MTALSAVLSRNERIALRDAASDDMITLYTGQHRDHWDASQKTGFLRCNFKKSDMYDYPEHRRAYRFMISRVRQVMPIVGNIRNYAPIWAYPKITPSFYRRKDKNVLLELRIPRRRILFSVFRAWEWVLDDWMFRTKYETADSTYLRSFKEKNKERYDHIFDIVDFDKYRYQDIFPSSEPQEDILIQACIDHIDLATDVVLCDGEPYTLPPFSKRSPQCRIRSSRRGFGMSSVNNHSITT